MTDIAKPIRRELSELYSISRPRPVDIQISKDKTRKYLFELGDGALIESVLIYQPSRSTLCVSSQVGCAIGCSFCRTARMGLVRNLKTAEIVSQVLAVQDDCAAGASKTAADAGRDGGNPLHTAFQNIVFMGMGEPFHNIDSVIRAVRILNDPLGCDFSGRKITVSTSGLVPGIEKFGNSGAAANLAVSLNATTDDIRSQLIPINKKWPLAVLLDALRAYPLKKNRKITVEYVMLHSVNDTAADLARLPGLLKGIEAKLNLIPYNENAGLGFKTPPKSLVYRWQQTLLDAGLNSTIRWSKGDDIDAACGQLATQKKAA